MEPDALLELPGQAGTARCALWWRQPLSGSGASQADSQAGRIGRIGRLEAHDSDSARRLLQRAGDALRQHGCSSALAPIDGDTWHPYRVLLSPREPALAFAGEPALAPVWADWLAAAGFQVRCRYVSALCTDLQRRRPRASPLAPCRIEPLSGGGSDPLESIHRLVVTGFRRQPLFRAPGLEDFRRLWLPWRTLLDPQLSLLACEASEAVGLLLAHRDRPGGSRAVVRTLVVLPGRRWAGLGRQLLEQCHGRAAAAGCDGVIHALMHDPGASLALSRPYAQPFRQYALMGRSLEGAPSDQSAAEG